MASQFREASYAWAAAWKDAIDQQNRILQARRWEYNKDHQGLFGHLDGVERPHDPAPRPLPAPPDFQPHRRASRSTSDDRRLSVAGPAGDVRERSARPRAAAVDEQASLSGLAKSVAAGCPGRAVDVPALGALTTVLENMATNEAFVATVRDAVDGCRHHRRWGRDRWTRPSSTPPCSRAGLADGPPMPVEFDPTTREVVAADIGDDRRPDQRRQRQHDPPRDSTSSCRRSPPRSNIERTWNSLLADVARRLRGRAGPRSSTSPSTVAGGRVTASLADGNVVAFVPWRGRLGRRRVCRGCGCRVTTTAGRCGPTPCRRFAVRPQQGALTGWARRCRAGRRRPRRRRPDRRLDEAVTGRSLHVALVDGRVSSTSSSPTAARPVRYERDADGRLLRGHVRRPGAVEYRWDGRLLRLGRRRRRCRRLRQRVRRRGSRDAARPARSGGCRRTATTTPV